MDTVCLKALIHFEQKPDYISIESEKVSFNKLKEEFSLFTKLGYTKYQAINQRNITRQKEPRYSEEGHYLEYQFEFDSSGLFGSDLSSEWRNHEQILKKYKRIFLLYKLIGESSKLRSFYISKILFRAIIKLLRKPLSGWYDTHARHSSVNP